TATLRRYLNREPIGPAPSRTAERRFNYSLLQGQALIIAAGSARHVRQSARHSRLAISAITPAGNRAVIQQNQTMQPARGHGDDIRQAWRRICPHHRPIGLDRQGEIVLVTSAVHADDREQPAYQRSTATLRPIKYLSVALERPVLRIARRYGDHVA